MKPRPDMSDEEATVEAITEGCALYGSPKTMLDKLVAFRDEVGPFGTLLMTGLDWTGPNEAWERQSMPLLAQEVHAEIPAARARASGGVNCGTCTIAAVLGELHAAALVPVGEIVAPRGCRATRVSYSRRSDATEAAHHQAVSGQIGVREGDVAEVRR